MFERFTDAARNAVVSAQEYARTFGHPEIGAGHVLLGAVEDDQQVAGRVLDQLGVDRRRLIRSVEHQGSPDADALRTLGIDLDEVRRQAEIAFGPGALDRTRRQRKGLFGHRIVGGAGHIPFNAEAKSSLEAALQVALAEHHRSIGTEHLLLGLLATTPGTAMLLLRSVGVQESEAAIKSRVLRELGRAA